MTWLLSYIGSTWVLIVVIALALVALGALAWLSHNWKLAVGALVILAASFAYMHVDKQAYGRRVAEENAAKVDRLESQISTMNKASAADALRAMQDAERISALESKVNDTPKNDRVCLDRNGAGRVRAIR